MSTPEQEESAAGGGTTTVLDPGTVEARGIGTDPKAHDEVREQIEAFLEDNHRSGWLFGWNPRSEARAFFCIWIFVTRLPAPAWVELHPGYLMTGMPYFPVLGALIGIITGVYFDLARVALGLPGVVAASVSTAASFRLTGCFHEDGLGDSADGIGGGWTRAQILRIMTDTRLGTYGSAALILYAFTKLQLLAALDESRWQAFDSSCAPLADWNNDFCGSRGAGPALLASHVLARVTAPHLIFKYDYVEEDGPKSNFYGFMVRAKFLVTPARLLAAWLFAFGVAAVLYGPVVAGGLCLVVLVYTEYAGSFGYYTLGGVMGDYLGATICIGEIVALAYLVGARSVLESLLEHWAQAGDDLSERLAADERCRVLLRFAVVTGLTAAWRWCYQYPWPMEEASPKETTKTTDEEKTGTKDTPEQPSEASSPTKKPIPPNNPQQQAAAEVLEATESTFVQKYEAAQEYLDALAKPVGSLGALEEWAARLAALQGTIRPDASQACGLIFAGDHGVAKAPDAGGEGCSAYPQVVTRSVVQGLQSGRAGASILAKANGVPLKVVDVGVVGDAFEGGAVESDPRKLSAGTRNFCNEAAMTVDETDRCIQMGRDSFSKLVESTSSNVVALGEVGIGNTTVASALIAAFTENYAIEDLCGGGAFAGKAIDEAAVAKKVAIVKKALKKHMGCGFAEEAFVVLGQLGGAELAAMVGAMLEASERNVAVLVDGFICTAAAMVAACISPDVCRVLFLSTRSAEPGHVAAVEKIQEIAAANDIPKPSSPALSMGLRMGEGTGALLAVPILKSATAILSDMATIQEILSGS